MATSMPDFSDDESQFIIDALAAVISEGNTQK
jgi:hypothetical protein